MKYIDYAEMYLDMQKDVYSKSCHSNYVFAFDRFIKDWWKDYELDQINSMECQKYLNFLLTHPKHGKPGEFLGQHTVRDIMGIFKQICYEAMRTGYMNEFNFKLKYPKTKSKSKGIEKRQIVTKAEYKKIIEVCTDDNLKSHKIGMLIQLLAGLRIGEVCGLQWKDIDFKKNVIKVNKTVYRAFKSREKCSELVISDSPKTESSIREVPMTKILRKTLQRYKELKKVNNNDFFVISNVDGKPTEPRTLRQGMRRVFEKHKIEYIHSHGLRHSFCTYAIDNKCDITVVSSLMGHAHTDMTLNIYTHMTETQVKNTMKIMNKALAKFEVDS